MCGAEILSSILVKLPYRLEKPIASIVNASGVFLWAMGYITYTYNDIVSADGPFVNLVMF